MDKNNKILSDFIALKDRAKKAFIGVKSRRDICFFSHTIAATAKNNILESKTPEILSCLNTESISKVIINCETKIKMKYIKILESLFSFKHRVNTREDPLTRKKDIKKRVKLSI